MSWDSPPPGAVTLAVTATRKGLTAPQLEAAAVAMLDVRPDRLLHGCAVGGDQQLVTLAWDLFGRRKTRAGAPPGPEPLFVVAHPSGIKGQTSITALICSNWVEEAKPPLKRNADMVALCQTLLACPDGPEVRRSGTWATVRLARKKKVAVVIVMPDGTTTKEPGGSTP